MFRDLSPIVLASKSLFFFASEIVYKILLTTYESFNNDFKLTRLVFEVCQKFEAVRHTVEIRSPSLGACNSHNKPMQRHFYRPVYF